MTDKLTRLCEQAASGGPLLIGDIIAAGLEAGYPTRLDVVNIAGGNSSLAIETIATFALQGNPFMQIWEIAEKVPRVYLGSGHFVPGQWLDVFKAIEAWRRAVAPIYTKSSLPEDLSDRLRVLCSIIERTNEGLDMAPVYVCLSELGVPDRFDGYSVAVGSSQQTGHEYDRNTIVGHAANNSTASVTSSVCAIDYKMLGDTHVIHGIGIPLTEVCEALIRRRRRLHIKC